MNSTANSPGPATLRIILRCVITFTFWTYCRFGRSAEKDKSQSFLLDLMSPEKSASNSLDRWERRVYCYKYLQYFLHHRRPLTLPLGSPVCMKEYSNLWATCRMLWSHTAWRKIFLSVCPFTISKNPVNWCIKCFILGDKASK